MFDVKIDRKEDIAALAPTDVRKAIAERSEKLHLVFEEAGENMDPSKVKTITATDGQALAKQIKAMNDELSWLGERATELDELDKAKSAAERWGQWAKSPAGKDPGKFAPKGGPKDEPKAMKSLGQAFVDSPAYQEALNKKSANFEFDDVDAKALLEMKTVMSTSAGWAPENLRTGRVVLDAQRDIEVVDAIPIFPTSQAAVVYMEETTFTNNAAERAEAAAYAEGALALTEQSSTVRSIGVSLPVTDEQLSDVDGIRAYIDGRLVFMVRQRLDGQILTGDGNAPNLDGTFNVSGINTQAKGTDSVPDAVYKGITAARVTGRAMPNVAIFHPNDWQDVRLLKTADGVYIWGSPAEVGPARIWGLPVIETSACTENSAIVGDYARYAGLFVREGVQVQTGYVNDDFLDGRVTIRAGLRAALVHFRPAAFTEVTGI